MANGSNWDTYAEPPKKGMGLWAKLSVGCGAVALLLLGSCIGLAYWAHSERGKEFVADKINGWLEAPWTKMVEVAEAIKTDEGALKLYEENRGLIAQYPSKEVFLKQAKVWRPAFSEIPTEPPPIESLGSGNFEFNKRQENKTTFLKISYKLPDMTYITLSWEDDELVGIEVR
ncbi:MAG: hypothetical protein LBC63_05600 [Holophagales bacterium]|jgi:hypothetical protein|nr:hypothetical protein [Holophagales bacterium]